MCHCLFLNLRKHNNQGQPARIQRFLLNAYVGNCIRAFSEQKKCEVVELNVQIDHVHLIVSIPPKLSVSSYVGMVKGRTAIRVLQRFRELRQKPYWGNHFWTKGYCVDTIGLDLEKIQAYVQYQDTKDQQVEQRQLGL